GDLLGTVNGDASSPVCDYTVYRYGPGHSSKDATRYQHKTQEDKTGTHARLQTPYWWSNKKVRYKAHDNLQVLWLLLRYRYGHDILCRCDELLGFNTDRLGRLVFGGLSDDRVVWCRGKLA